MMDCIGIAAMESIATDVILKEKKTVQKASTCDGNRDSKGYFCP